MKNPMILAMALAMSMAQLSLNAQAVDYNVPKPLSQVVNTSLKPVQPGTVKVPIITWGGDMATILAESDGIFKNEGLNVSLFREDDFKKQVQMCLSGQTPYLRGTMGMINAAADAFKNSGTDLVVIYQLTWSTGGDALVVRQGKNLNNIKNVALQLYGPHMDYAANLFNKAGRLNSVQFKWLSQLTISDREAGKIIDPVTAFQEDATLDAVMCIIPDALFLTSNGAVGTGAEGSVKGASILLSTKTASRVIADVYAVRKDYFDANKKSVTAFVKALMKAEEQLSDLQKNKSAQLSKYRQLMITSAEKLLGSSQFTSDAEALLADCEFAGFNGNISFFTGQGTTRNFDNLNAEIGRSFKTLGLLTSSVNLANANWDYAGLSSGLKYANASKAPIQKFDQQKVTKIVESKIQAESTSWEEEGTLFVVEINFDPNQSEFSIEKYAGDFAKALDIAETNSGALVVIEGHSDPLGILKAEKALRDNEPGHQSAAEIAQMKQRVKSLSLERSQNVRQSFLNYCKNKGVKIDESQFVAVGMGVQNPKYSPPKTKDEWNANRRVVFRIKQVEAELDEFSPL
jgi:ABC-type nitrate/sulfonate/bicarbonate transport system substrate-binding protein/outer membrane protein OmpA-like peptidoglycan-associated protein